jgi:hypothetical protein
MRTITPFLNFENVVGNQVSGVGLGDAIDSGSAVNSVDIHIEGH